MEVLQTRSFGVIEGILSEKNIKIQKLNDGREKIQGTISIENKKGIYRINVNNIFHYKKDVEEIEENETKSWKNWIGFMDKALDKKNAILKNETPSMVSCSISLNVYEKYNENTKKINTYSNLSGNFITVVPELNLEEAKAEFSMDCIVKNVKPEVKNQIETGRAIIETFVVDYYKNLHTVEVYVPEEFFDAVMNGYVDEMNGSFVEKLEPNDTITLYCSIENNSTSQQPQAHSGFGRKINLRQGFFKQEYLLVGADIPKNKSGNPVELEKAYDEQTIEQLKKEMDIRFDEMMQNGARKENNLNTEQSSIRDRVKNITMEDMPF